MSAAFRIPLDLPHAGTVALRIAQILERRLQRGARGSAAALGLTQAIAEQLWPFHLRGENPARGEGLCVRDSAAELGRRLVDVIESEGLGEDRLGQCVRNLFECLELGEEGAAISLRAGEDPNSIQRPS